MIYLLTNLPPAPRIAYSITALNKRSVMNTCIRSCNSILETIYMVQLGSVWDFYVYLFVMDNKQIITEIKLLITQNNSYISYFLPSLKRWPTITLIALRQDPCILNISCIVYYL